MEKHKNLEYIISVDAGTSKIKVVVFSTDGDELMVVTKDSRIVKEKGRMEIDMMELWQSVALGIRDSIINSGIDRKSIKAVVFSAQGEGSWVVDKDYNPLGNAILWNDSRAEDIVGLIRNDQDLYREVKFITGSYPRSGSTIVLLKWLKNTQPDIYRRIHCCFSCKDWLRYKLTGDAFCDMTDASTSILNLQTGEYAFDLFQKIGIEEAPRFLPPLVRSTDICGTVSLAGEKETLIPRGTPVAAGMLDIVSTSVGTGAVNVGDVCTILGTSCINEITTDHYVLDENKTGWECHLPKGLYINVAGAMAGTPNLDWGLANIMGQTGFNKQFVNDLERELAGIPVGSNGLIYHPYISPCGERAPFVNPMASGQISGIKISTTRKDMMRSIYEGVALAAKDCLSNLKGNGRIFLTGGGSKSLFWAQIISDCVGREVVIGRSEEFSARGGAIAAAIACGVFKDVNEATGIFCRPEHRLEPNGENNRKYAEIYQMYKEMRISADAYWKWRDSFLKENP